MYDLNYFFSQEEAGDYVLLAPKEQMDRQLFAQYPTKEVMERSVVMNYFDDETSVNVNQMWINVRCFDLAKIPKNVFYGGVILLLLIVIAFLGSRFRNKE